MRFLSTNECAKSLPKIPSSEFGLYINGRIAAMVGTFYAAANETDRSILNSAQAVSDQADLVMRSWFSDPHKRRRAADLQSLRLLRSLHANGREKNDTSAAAVWLQTGSKGYDRRLDAAMYGCLQTVINTADGSLLPPIDELVPKVAQPVLQTDEYTITRISNGLQTVYTAHEQVTDYVLRLLRG